MKFIKIPIKERGVDTENVYYLRVLLQKTFTMSRGNFHLDIFALTRLSFSITLKSENVYFESAILVFSETCHDRQA